VTGRAFERDGRRDLRREGANLKPWMSRPRATTKLRGVGVEGRAKSGGPGCCEQEVWLSTSSPPRSRLRAKSRSTYRSSPGMVRLPRPGPGDFLRRNSSVSLLSTRNTGAEARPGDSNTRCLPFRDEELRGRCSSSAAHARGRGRDDRLIDTALVTPDAVAASRPVRTGSLSAGSRRRHARPRLAHAPIA